MDRKNPIFSPIFLAFLAWAMQKVGINRNLSASPANFTVADRPGTMLLTTARSPFIMICRKPLPGSNGWLTFQQTNVNDSCSGEPSATGCFRLPLNRKRFMIQAGFPIFRRALAFVALAILIAPAAVAAQAPVDGLFITVPDPITDAHVQQIKHKVKDAVEAKKRNISIIVFDFNPKGLPAGTNSFGSCHDLADYITRDLGSIKTIAFVHNKVTRHTVLPVLACGRIVMSKDKERESGKYKARLGDVLADQEGGLSETARNAYEIAAKKYSKGLVFRMIDKFLVVKKVLLQNSVLYLCDEEIKQRRDKGEQLIVETEIPRGLEAGNTSVDWTASAFGLVSNETFSTREALAHALRLPPRSLHEDWLVGRTPVVWRIEVRGTLDDGKIQSLD